MIPPDAESVPKRERLHSARYLEAVSLLPSPWSIGLGRPLFGCNRFGGRAMWPLDSYRDVLSGHTRGHRVVASAWIIVAVLAVLLVIFG